MVCKKCGKNIKVDIGICPYCGEELESIKDIDKNNDVKTIKNSFAFDLENLKMDTGTESNDIMSDDNSDQIIPNIELEDNYISKFDDSVNSDNVLKEITNILEQSNQYTDELINNNNIVVPEQEETIKKLNIQNDEVILQDVKPNNFENIVIDKEELLNSEMEEDSDVESLNKEIEDLEIEKVYENPIENEETEEQQEITYEEEKTLDIEEENEENKLLDELKLKLDKINTDNSITPDNNQDIDINEEVEEQNENEISMENNISVPIEVENEEQNGDVEKVLQVEENNKIRVTHDMNRLLESDTVDVTNVLKETTKQVEPTIMDLEMKKDDSIVSSEVIINPEVLNKKDENKEEPPVLDVKKKNNVKSMFIYIIVTLLLVVVAIFIGYLLSK